MSSPTAVDLRQLQEQRRDQLSAIYNNRQEPGLAALKAQLDLRLQAALQHLRSCSEADFRQAQGRCDAYESILKLITTPPLTPL